MCPCGSSDATLKGIFIILKLSVLKVKSRICFFFFSLKSQHYYVFLQSVIVSFVLFLFMFYPYCELIFFFFGDFTNDSKKWMMMWLIRYLFYRLLCNFTWSIVVYNAELSLQNWLLIKNCNRNQYRIMLLKSENALKKI